MLEKAADTHFSPLCIFFPLGTHSSIWSHLLKLPQGQEKTQSCVSYFSQPANPTKGKNSTRNIERQTSQDSVSIRAVYIYIWQVCQVIGERICFIHLLDNP